MSKGISVTDSMLAAMAAGCVLHDVYSAGFKSRPALYYRELRHSDGRTKAVTAGVINRLAEDGLIESTGRSIERGSSHDVVIALTSAGRARGASIENSDLDKFMNEVPDSPEKRAAAECRRILRRLIDGEVRIVDKIWRGYKLVSSKPGFNSIYEPISRATLEACLPHLEKYREPGEGEDLYRLTAEGRTFVASLPAARRRQAKEAA